MSRNLMFVLLVLVSAAAFHGCSGGDTPALDNGTVHDAANSDGNIAGDATADADGTDRDAADGADLPVDLSDVVAADLAPTDVDVSATDGAGTEVSVDDSAESDVADAADVVESTFYTKEYCAYFITGEVQLVGTDADGDGISNGWDHCPNNPYDWLDSDRDGIGNKSDPDIDGDGILNDADSDRDGDGFDDAAETVAGTDVSDPSSVPGLRRFDTDLGVRNPNPGWYLGDLHVHVEYSHDSSSPLSLYFGAAEGAGLDFLAITDHDVFEAPFDPDWDQQDLLLIPGMEWGGSGGHANQWGIRTWNDAATDLPDDIRKSWRQARLQGGVQSLNHYGADADTLDPLFAAAPDLFDQLDVIEIWNLVWTFTTGTNEPSIALWERLLNEGHRLGAVGGGDSHTPVATLGSPTTAVYAESLTVPGILHGIRKGRTYITQADPLGFEGRPELDFRVDADDDGVFEAMLGDEVRPGHIDIQVNVINAKGPVVLIRNGVQLIRWADHKTGATVKHTVPDNAPAGAWYRVEMRETALSYSPMRLMSSAIYVGK